MIVLYLSLFQSFYPAIGGDRCGDICDCAGHSHERENSHEREKSHKQEANVKKLSCHQEKPSSQEQVQSSPTKSKKAKPVTLTCGCCKALDIYAFRGWIYTPDTSALKLTYSYELIERAPSLQSISLDLLNRPPIHTLAFT